MTDQVELQKLRTSLLRIAQVCGMQLEDLPPAIRPASWAYPDLAAVFDRPRGWNALAADIVGRILDERRNWRSLTEEIVTRLEEHVDAFQGPDA